MATEQTPSPIQATPAKLPSGDWGARSDEDAAIGDTVQITTRSGKTWTATVTGITSRGLLETQSAPRKKSSKVSKPRRTSSSTRNYSYGRRKGCGYPGCDGTRYCDECTD